MNDFKISLSASASEYIKKKLETENGTALRLSIKKTGCSGYSYSPTIMKEINNNDLLFKLDNGIVLLIDPIWREQLEGVYVDYIEETKSGLKQKKLVFTNSKEGERCGCGESFQLVKEDE